MGDSNSNHPGVAGAWFRVREDGKYIKPPPLGLMFRSDDPNLGWIPLAAFSVASSSIIPHNTTTPSASQFKDEIDSESVNLRENGLYKSNPIILEVKKDGDGPGREYNPDVPGKIGYWFIVQDENGNNIDVSYASGATDFDKYDSTLGWNPLPKDPDLPSDIWHAGAGLVKTQICQSLDLNPQDYKVYASQSDDASNFIGDNYVIDFRTVGERKNNPMLVKYDNSGNAESGREGDYEGNEQGYSGNSGTDDTDNTDPYINFTKRIQNITTGDWNIYPEAIRDTYSGEILWTDGDASHGLASSQAYKVVRRNPSVYNGRVIQTGLAVANNHYFHLVD